MDVMLNITNTMQRLHTDQLNKDIPNNLPMDKNVLDHNPASNGHHQILTTLSRPLSNHLITKSKKIVPNPNPTKRTIR